MENQKILMSQIKLETGNDIDSLNKIVSKDREESEDNMKLPDQFEDDMQCMIESMIMRPNSMFSEVILYKKEFVGYLEGKLKTPLN